MERVWHLWNFTGRLSVWLFVWIVVLVVLRFIAILFYLDKDVVSAGKVLEMSRQCHSIRVKNEDPQGPAKDLMTA